MLKFWKNKEKAHTDVGFRDDFTEVDQFKLPGWANTTLLILTSLFVILLIWACLAKIDKIVKARGKLVTTGQEIVVRPLVDSIVKSLDVSIGQVVKKGQKIMTLDPTFANSDLGQINIKIENASATIYRIQCVLNHKKFEIPKEDKDGIYLLQSKIYQQQTSEFESRVQSFDSQKLSAREAARSAKAQLEELNKQIEYANQIRQMRQEVYSAGYDTKLNLLQAEKECSQNLTQAESLQKTIASSELEIKKLESDKNAFINDWNKELSTEMAKTQSELDTYREQLNKARLYSNLVDMTVPQDSVVLEIGKISVGAVAKTGEALVTLVPLNEPLEAEIHIEPQDVGFIRNGDPCKVKIDAFPFQKHGSLPGSLKSVSEDTVNDQSRQQNNTGPYYVGRVTLESTKLNKVPDDTRLVPGMSLAAEIVVGQRTVITYILYPMISIFDESIREP